MKLTGKYEHKNVYIVSILSRICSVVIGLIYSILLARYLGTELRGQLSYVNSITTVTVIVFSFGVHQAYPYYKKNGRDNIAKKYNHVCILLFLFQCVIAGSVAYTLYAKLMDQRVIIAVLLTPILVVTKLITYQMMVENPNKKNYWEVICEALEVIALVFLLLFSDKNLIYVLAVIIIKNAMACIYYLKYLKFDIYVEKSDFGFLKEIMVFGFFPMLSLLMNNLNYRVDIIMLGNSVADSQIGIYSVGIQIAERVWLVSEAMRDVLFSKLVNGKDIEEVNKVIRICFTISLIVVIGIIVLGRPFINICYGKEYLDAYYPLIIVLSGTLVMVFYKIIQAYNNVHKKQKLNFWFLFISVLVNILLNACLIPLRGVIGAAIASLISYIVCATLFVVEYLYSTKSKFESILFINKNDVVAIKQIISH